MTRAFKLLRYKFYFVTLVRLRSQVIGVPVNINSTFGNSFCKNFSPFEQVRTVQALNQSGHKKRQQNSSLKPDSQNFDQREATVFSKIDFLEKPSHTSHLNLHYFFSRS